ncbi:MAG: TIGR03668 family PPOX class F420-dependent oxidoreductase [Armatimonadota bacterium]|nr:TIGR03668 family PPOX class F420-dependent oxidoreductase [Armatimonadota bacterium]MDR7519246.1 TIGR03668 family PPOX class F420-dependent oxidoreductase [Armatimonadota bacterium]
MRPRLPRAVAAFLSGQRVARLATADASGRPHVVPICFVLSGRTLYSVIDRKPKQTEPRRLRRVRNVLENPRVAVGADTYSEDWSRLGFVLLEGRARLLHRGSEHAAALRLLRRKYPQYRAMDLEGRPIIAVRIERAVQWGDLRSGGRGLGAK